MDFSFLSRLTPWTVSAYTLVLTSLLALFLALFGWFFPLLAILFLSLMGFAFAFAGYRLYLMRDFTRLFLLLALALFALLIMLRTEPTVFTGRDQGSIAIAAWELAKGHELAFRTTASNTFFNVYGSGVALNFPGFSYTETGALLSQFPLGYTSFLALFVSLFGIAGYALGNALLLVFSGWTFFELLSRFLHRKIALFGTVLFVFSFSLIWLSQMTLTENLALPLFLILGLALLSLERTPKPEFVFLVLGAGFLLALTRIEGFALFPLALLYLFIRREIRSLLFTRPLLYLAIPLFFMLFFFLRDFFINLPFYTAIGKVALKYWHEVSGVTVHSGGTPALGPIFFSYGLFLPFLFGFAGFVMAIAKRQYTLILLTLLAGPTLLYFFDSHISDDHPWFLRRYIFILYPIFLLLSLWLIQTLSEKIQPLRRTFFVALSCLVLLFFQGWPAIQALAIIERDGLLQNTALFSQQFGARDLLLIDRSSSGDPYTLLAGPLSSLYRKVAVYFFNPEDINRIDRSGFERIYLLTGDDHLAQYVDTLGPTLTPIEVVTFEIETLTAPGPFRFPIRSTLRQDAVLFEVKPL